MSKIRQRTKNLWIAGLVGASVVGLLLIGYIVYSQIHLQQAKKEMREQYELQIRKLEKARKEQQLHLRTTWVLKKGIAAGTQITFQDVAQADIPEQTAPQTLIGNKDDLIGKVAKIDLAQNTPLISSMFFEEGRTPDDLRNQQFAEIILPMNIKKGDYIDVRIQFPTGQDYIVLSKKRIELLTENMIWLHMNEQEILLMSSAIVDAYMNKGSIYGLTYVDPQMQTRAIVNYPANVKVLDLIESDPNIVETAKTALARVARQKLEKDLSSITEQERMQFEMQIGKNTGYPAADSPPITSNKEVTGPLMRADQNSLEKNELVKPLHEQQLQVLDQP